MVARPGNALPTVCASVVLALAATMTTTPATALVGEDRPRPPAARPAAALPARVDVWATYQPQVMCDPVAKSGTLALGELLQDRFDDGAVGYERACSAAVSEHSDGRALDWMLDAANPQDKALADEALAWLLADDATAARRLGVQYIIWDRRIWRAYRSAQGWQPYTGASPHTDHVHISLTWDGAMGRTSWWSGKAVTQLTPGP